MPETATIELVLEPGEQLHDSGWFIRVGPDARGFVLLGVTDRYLRRVETFNNLQLRSHDAIPLASLIEIRPGQQRHPRRVRGDQVDCVTIGTSMGWIGTYAAEGADDPHARALIHRLTAVATGNRTSQDTRPPAVAVPQPEMSPRHGERHCPNCGLPLDLATRACIKCGLNTALPRPATPAPTSPPATSTPTSPVAVVTAPHPRPLWPWVMLGVVGVYLLIAIIGGTLTSDDGDRAPSGDGAPSDPIDQMALTFTGSPSRDQIEPQVTRAMTLYKLPATDDTRSRIGSVLIAFKQQYDIPEMQLLDCVIRTATPGVTVSFADSAGLNAAVIVTTGSCG